MYLLRCIIIDYGIKMSLHAWLRIVDATVHHRFEYLENCIVYEVKLIYRITQK